MRGEGRRRGVARRSSRSASRRRRSAVAADSGFGRRRRTTPRTRLAAARRRRRRRRRARRRRRWLGLRLAGDLDWRPSARTTSIKASSFAGAATDSNGAVALDGGQRVPPQQPLVEPVPERFADTEPVRHTFDDQAVGDPGCRRPAIEQGERVVEQVVRFEGRRERRADRDDIGPVGRARRPGRRRGPRSNARASEAVRQRPKPRRSAESGDRARQARHSGRVPTGWVGACIVPECPIAECRRDRSASNAHQAIGSAGRPGPGSLRVRPGSRLSAVPRQRPDRQGSARPASTDCGGRIEGMRHAATIHEIRRLSRDG